MNHYFSIEENLTKEYSILKTKKGKISNFRLFSFVITVLLFSYYVLTSKEITLYTSIITFIVFIVLVVKAKQ